MGESDLTIKLLDFRIYGDGSSEYEMEGRFDKKFYEHIEKQLNKIEMEILEYFGGDMPQNIWFNESCKWAK